MIEIVREIRENNKGMENLDIRIGVHTGKITAGLIGNINVRYDIFGQDVLIANEMESIGIPGKMIISDDTKKILEKLPLKFRNFNIVHYKSAQCKTAKKEINSYIVED